MRLLVTVARMVIRIVMMRPEAGTRKHLARGVLFCIRLLRVELVWRLISRLPLMPLPGRLYGDGTPTPESIGFLRSLGETHVAAFRTAHLGNGFFGFASVAGSAGPTFRKGGDVGPLPEGLLTLAFHVTSQTSNGLFIDIDTAAGLFMDELTSITVSITREGLTAQTYLLTTVTEVETGIRRFQDHFAVTSGTKLYEAGEHNLVSFTLSSSADPVDIHGGTAVVKVIDEFNLQEVRAAVHQEIAPLEEELEGFENQYLGANLHGDLFDIDNPLDLNHQEIISDDLVTIKYSHGTLAENQALNNRYVGHRVTIGNEELYLTQYQQFLNPEVHIAYKAVVMELDADGRVTTVTSSLTRLANRDNSQEFAFNFIDLGVTLQADTDYSIGIMQYGGFTELNLGVLEFTTANTQDPVVAPNIAQNADDIVLGRIDRVTSGSTGWRPDDAIGHLLTAGPADHRQGKPYFIFHKNLSALFINPPNLAVQNAGFLVETVDINNKVKVIDFSSAFVVPDSATEKVQVSIVHASHALVGITRYATDEEALAGTAGGHAISPASLQAVLDDQGVAATDFVGLSDTADALGTAGQIPAVNAAGDALEFVDAGTDGGSGSGTGAFVRTELFADTAARSGSDADAIAVTLIRVPVEGSKIEITLSKEYGTAPNLYYTHVHMEEIESDEWLDGRVVLDTDTRPDGVDADGSDGDYHLVRVSRPGTGTTFSSAATSMYVGRVSDTELLIKPGIVWAGNYNPFRISVREVIPSGGGAGAQSSGISLFHRVVVGAEQTLNGHLLSDFWENSTFEFINFTDVDVGELLYIDFTVRIGDEVEQVHRVSRNTLRAIGFQNTTGYSPYLNSDNSVINSAIVPTFMVMGNQGSGNLREDLIRPTMGRVEAHRGSGRGMVMFFFVENGGALSQINVSTRSNLVIKLTRMDIVLEQEAA